MLSREEGIFEESLVQGNIQVWESYLQVLPHLGNCITKLGEYQLRNVIK